VLAIGFEAAAFGTNCYVLATAAGQECLVVDPGIGVLDTLAEVLGEYRLRPSAVLLTHGHADHVYSVTPVCSGHGVPAVIHVDDRYRLADPLRTLDRQLVAMLEAQFGRSSTWVEPDDVRTVTGAACLELAGLKVEVLHAPGHTEGSVMFALDGVPDGVAGIGAGIGVSGGVELTSTLVTGDVLFAGSIGRTDLPGGDHGAMQRSLREQVLTRPDAELVLPGHGPRTSIGRERAANPYLRALS
jgi:hydroxyacylglutathione hydrolase